MSFTRIAAVAVAASALWCGSASAAGPLRPFRHGFWSGGAYADDRTGAFTHCSAGVAYDSGINLFVLNTRSNAWWLGLIDPLWSLDPDAKMSVQLRFDNITRFELLATVPNRQLMLIPLLENSRLVGAFRRALRLNLVAAGRSFSFELRQTSAVMDELTRCVRTSVALDEAAHGSRAAAADAGSPALGTKMMSPGGSGPANPASAPTAAAGGSGSSGSIADLTATIAQPLSAGEPAAASSAAQSPAQTVGAMWAWISIIAVGALMGLVGQGIRAIVGLKKASDEAAALGHKFTEMIEPIRLIIGLLIGALAGAMAAIAALMEGAPVSRAALFGLGAAGYSGADLIEGLVARYLPRCPRPLLRFAAVEASPDRR